VVVNQFDIECIRILKTEDDTPVCGHSYGPKAFAVAFE
jgi:hypothetical protein